MRRSNVIVFAVAWLSLSLGAKALRYGAPVDKEAQNIVAIEQFLTGRGWTAVQRGETGNHIYAFRKTGCEDAIHVAMLSTGAEEASLLRRRFSSNLLFFQDAQPVETPSIWRVHLTKAVQAVTTRFATTSTQTKMPLLAVSPRPASADGPCMGPSAGEWCRWLLM